MTKRECAIVMAYTGIVTLTGNDLGVFYKYVEEKMGRPIFSHEMGTLADEIKEKSKADFIELCRTATDDNEKERIHNMFDEEIKKLQPSYKHIAAIKLLESMKEKI